MQAILLNLDTVIIRVTVAGHLMVRIYIYIYKLQSIRLEMKDEIVRGEKHASHKRLWRSCRLRSHTATTVRITL